MPIEYLTGSSRRLTDDRDRKNWEEVARHLGEDSPYVCKAAHVCGVVRQLVESAALSDAARRNAPAFQAILSAAELLGRCVLGHTTEHGAVKRLRAGVAYLSDLSTDAPKLDLEQCVGIRHFVDHGLGFSKGLRMDRRVFGGLVYRSAGALDRFWRADGDAHHHVMFAASNLTPIWVWTRNSQDREPAFVSGILEHLRRENLPSTGLPTDMPYLDTIEGADRWPRDALHGVLWDLNDHE
jgi:hypothetical protein